MWIFWSSDPCLLCLDFYLVSVILLADYDSNRLFNVEDNVSNGRTAECGLLGTGRRSYELTPGVHPMLLLDPLLAVISCRCRYTTCGASAETILFRPWFLAS